MMKSNTLPLKIGFLMENLKMKEAKESSTTTTKRYQTNSESNSFNKKKTFFSCQNTKTHVSQTTETTTKNRWCNNNYTCIRTFCIFIPIRGCTQVFKFYLLFGELFYCRFGTASTQRITLLIHVFMFSCHLKVPIYFNIYYRKEANNNNIPSSAQQSNKNEKTSTTIATKTRSTSTILTIETRTIPSKQLYAETI